MVKNASVLVKTAARQDQAVKQKIVALASSWPLYYKVIMLTTLSWLLDDAQFKKFHKFLKS